MTSRSAGWSLFQMGRKTSAGKLLDLAIRAGIYFLGCKSSYSSYTSLVFVQRKKSTDETFGIHHWFSKWPVA